MPPGIASAMNSADFTKPSTTTAVSLPMLCPVNVAQRAAISGGKSQENRPLGARPRDQGCTRRRNVRALNEGRVEQVFVPVGAVGSTARDQELDRIVRSRSTALVQRPRTVDRSIEGQVARGGRCLGNLRS